LFKGDKMESEKVITELNEIFQLVQMANNNWNNSFLGEYEVLEYITNQLEIAEGYLVDIAASDGYNQSCTYGFLKTKNWSGLAVEMDPIKFSKLAFLYKDLSKCKLARNKITPFNVAIALEANLVPKDFDILNLDIDSYDLHVIESILKSGYSPKILSMEINEKIPSGIYFSVNYDEFHYWKNDHFFGCSIDAAVEVVKPYGYILYACQFNNAIFVKMEMVERKKLHNEFIDLNSSYAYSIGYKNNENRLKAFPWNENVDHWLKMTEEEAILEIKNYFKNYENLFTIRKSKL
jgi:hypothetical protein